MKTKPCLLPLLAAPLLATSAHAAIIAQYNFDGGNLDATTNAAGVTASTMSIEAGTSSNPGEFLNASADQRAWSGRSFETDSSQWFQFEVTPTNPYTPTTITLFNSVNMNLAGGTSQANYTVSTSLDGFASSIVSVDGPVANASNRSVSDTVTLDISSLGEISGAVTYRVVMTNIGGTNGTGGQRGGRIDDVTLSAIPEPSTALLGGLGLLTLLRRRR
jgi:hypothetical protein